MDKKKKILLIVLGVLLVCAIIVAAVLGTQAKKKSQDPETPGISNGSSQNGGTSGGDGTGDDGKNGNGGTQTNKDIPSGWTISEESNRTIVNEAGTVSVVVDVLDYTSSQLDESEQLVRELLTGGLTDGTLISLDKDGNTITAIGSGTKIGAAEAKFFLLRVVAGSENSYLVTFEAGKQSDLEQDFSAIYDKLAELAAL